MKGRKPYKVKKERLNLIKFYDGFTTTGKILIVVNCLSLIFAMVLKNHAGVPFAILSLLFVCCAFRKSN